MNLTDSSNTWRNLRYGGAGFALGLPTIPLLVHLPALYAEHIGLGLTATGLALFVARLFDIVTDPLIGVAANVSSPQNNPLRRKKTLILIGSLIGAVGILFLLNPSPGASWLYLAFWSSVLYLGWTMINIPYMTWGAELSNSYKGRTRVTATREGFTLAGIIVAGAVPALAAIGGYNQAQAVSVTGWLVVGIGIILFAILLKGVDEPTVPPTKNPEPLKTALRGISTNGPFQNLIACWFINGMANGIPAVLFLLYMKHVLKMNELERGVLTFIYFFVGICGLAIWSRLADRLGKHKCWSLAMVIACLAFAAVPFLDEGDFIPFLIITVITGLTLGADLAIPPSMQADVAEHEHLRSGHNHTALMFALWSMVTKTALALSVLIAFPLLEASGFSTDSDQTENNTRALAVIYSLVPVVLKLLAIGIVWRHPLTAEKQFGNRRRLVEFENRLQRQDPK
jgi:glycoside/pentoside/hexuronide:cation symporter, GPH family